jgi:hypothetical protein
MRPRALVESACPQTCPAYPQATSTHPSSHSPSKAWAKAPAMVEMAVAFEPAAPSHRPLVSIPASAPEYAAVKRMGLVGANANGFFSVLRGSALHARVLVLDPPRGGSRPLPHARLSFSWQFASAGVFGGGARGSVGGSDSMDDGEGSHREVSESARACVGRCWCSFLALPRRVGSRTDTLPLSRRMAKGRSLCCLGHPVRREGRGEQGRLPRRGEHGDAGLLGFLLFSESLGRSPEPLDLLRERFDVDRGRHARPLFPGLPFDLTGRTAPGGSRRSRRG